MKKSIDKLTSFRISGRPFIFALAGLPFVLAQIASAAVITWQTPTEISGDTDVNTQGTTLMALNIGATGSGSPTINGVTFDYTGISSTPPATIPSGSTAEGALELDLNTGGWSVQNATVYGSSSAPFTDLSAGYQSLAASGAARNTASATSGTYTMQNLQIGQEYLAQFWVNDSRALAADLVTRFTSGSNTVDLNLNNGTSAGGLGTFVIGTFTADSASQTIDVAAPGSNGQIQLNAYQIRAIPEPGAFGFLLGVFAAGLLVIRRRRTRG